MDSAQMELATVNQTSVDTEELIESMGRFRQWVLPAGAMRELLNRGAEIAPVLHQHLTRVLAPNEGGLEQHAAEAFFCFHLLGGSRSPCREFIGQLLRSDDYAIDSCTGEVTQPYLRALIASFAHEDNLTSFCEWLDSLVQDDQVNEYGKLQAVDSLFNLVGEGVLQDSEAVRWIRKWLEDRKEFQQDEFSAMIVADLMDVGGKDLKELATECFKRDQIDEAYVSIDFLDRMPDDRKVDFLRERAYADRQTLLDPVSYLQKWHAFAWTTDSLDPQAATYVRIKERLGWRETNPDAQEIAQWLADIDRSSFDTYPREAIKESFRFIEHAVKQLKDRAERGIEWARQGKTFSSNAPYLAALMLAKNCDHRKIMLTDPDLFLSIVDLTSEQRFEWFGDSIDMHLVEALSRVLAGNTKPIIRRIGDSSRSEIDRASLVYFFPISVYQGFLSRDRCIEILKEAWISCLRENAMEDAGCRMVLGAIYDAFCTVSIADDDPIMVQATESGIGNLFLSADVAAAFQADPSKARDIMKTKVLGPARLEEAIKSGVQFSSDAINPPRPMERAASNPPVESHGTIRRDTQKVGRNSPCTCGSGKKFKKCCGKK